MMTRILSAITFVSALLLTGFLAGAIMEAHHIANIGGVAILSFATVIFILMIVAAVVEKDDP